MDKAYFPVKTIIPSTEIVHDRVMLELFRGCIRGCRFCQAGYAYRPVRNRDPKLLAEYGKAACEDSGYQEMTLSSLSSTDYPCLHGAVRRPAGLLRPRDIGLSLPSLRADTFSMNLMERLQRVRKGGLTFAPEAGTQRLRDAINKNLREEDLLQSAAPPSPAGWNGVKLYFHAGPAHRDGRGRAGHRRPGPEGLLQPGGSARPTRPGGCGSPCPPPGLCPSPTPPSSGRPRSRWRSTSAG
ncbi:MAG: radical SAM protein [Lawsonibacter sp.]